ncbi:MAG: sugar ABC transporter ATP-binding protein [Geminicoccaceae bacterium]
MARAGQILWELRHIRKAFPGVVANDDVSLRLRAGEIHALLGENGSGKTTLIKTLCGAHQPDAGTILRDGRPVVLASPMDARELGIATVFQEFSLVPTLTVAENIHLGRWPGWRAWLDWPRMRDEARRAFAAMEIEIDPDAIVGELSVPEQQLVEIAKAIALEASMIILDEPTAALGLAEIAHLHALLRRLRTQGQSVLYVSHRLDEVTALVDVATVLRNGRVASPAEATRIEIGAIVAAMVGAEVKEHYPKERNATAEPLLEVEGLAAAGGVREATFTVHRGEVLGLGGVLGSGRTAIARALFGLDRPTAGRIRLAGRELRARGPKDMIRAGLALLTEDRKADGLFVNFDTPRNITIANLGSIVRGGRLDLVAERRLSRAYVTKLQISPEAERKSVDFLSGGNQQKVIIARWLHADAEVFILDQPTQGIDIGAKIAVYRLINQLTRAGKGVILISADDDELLAMSDRVALVRHGAVTRIEESQRLGKAELVQSSEITEAAA